MPDQADDMLKKNWNAFTAAKKELEAKHMGRTALLHDGKVVAVYNDGGDAYAIGCEKYGLGHFTTQLIGQKPILIPNAFSAEITDFTQPCLRINSSSSN